MFNKASERGQTVRFNKATERGQRLGLTKLQKEDNG